MSMYCLCTELIVARLLEFHNIDAQNPCLCVNNLARLLACILIIAC